jgi:hypothetical protein
MAIGPMQFGADNNAGSAPPTGTILRSQNPDQATLLVSNNKGPDPNNPQPAGNGLEVTGGRFGVFVRGGVDSEIIGVGVHGEASGGTGVQGFGETGVRGENRTGVGNGVQGHSSSMFGSGVYGENLSLGGWGVAGRSNAIQTEPSIPGFGAAVWGDNIIGGWAGFFTGPVRVTGFLVKSGGGFQIDHPVRPANSYLNHSFVESPDMMNVYNGNVNTDAEGNATVELPGYFEALNRDFRY